MFTTENFMMRNVVRSLVTLLRVILEQISRKPLNWVLGAEQTSWYIECRHDGGKGKTENLRENMLKN